MTEYPVESVTLRYWIRKALPVVSGEAGARKLVLLSRKAVKATKKGEDRTYCTQPQGFGGFINKDYLTQLLRSQPITPGITIKRLVWPSANQTS